MTSVVCAVTFTEQCTAKHHRKLLLETTAVLHIITLEHTITSLVPYVHAHSKASIRTHRWWWCQGQCTTALTCKWSLHCCNSSLQPGTSTLLATVLAISSLASPKSWTASVKSCFSDHFARLWRMPAVYHFSTEARAAPRDVRYTSMLMSSEGIGGCLTVGAVSDGSGDVAGT